jgi:hypothetical protein
LLICIEEFMAFDSKPRENLEQLGLAGPMTKRNNPSRIDSP